VASINRNETSGRMSRFRLSTNKPNHYWISAEPESAGNGSAKDRYSASCGETSSGRKRNYPVDGDLE
jgi:hypothetical protein